MQRILTYHVDNSAVDYQGKLLPGTEYGGPKDPAPSDPSDPSRILGLGQVILQIT